MCISWILIKECPCTLRGSNPRSQRASGFSLPTCRPHGHHHQKYVIQRLNCILTCVVLGRVSVLTYDAHYFYIKHLNHNDYCILLYITVASIFKTEFLLYIRFMDFLCLTQQTPITIVNSNGPIITSIESKILFFLV